MILVDDRAILDTFTERFCRVIQKHTNYIVVSGFFAISSGRSRGTEDIDMIIEQMDEIKFDSLYNDLLSNGFECIQSDNSNELYSYLKENLSLRFVQSGTDVPNMEVKFVKDELDLYQLQTKSKYELTGIDIYFASVDVFLAFKEELLKSRKDLEDAKHIRVVYSNIINENEVTKVKGLIRRYRL